MAVWVRFHHGGHGERGFSGIEGSMVLDSAVEAESTRSRSQLRGAEATTAESRIIRAHP